MRNELWQHCRQFPECVTLGEGVLDEAIGLLNWLSSGERGSRGGISTARWTTLTVLSSLTQEHALGAAKDARETRHLLERLGRLGLTRGALKGALDTAQGLKCTYHYRRTEAA